MLNSDQVTPVTVSVQCWIKSIGADLNSNSIFPALPAACECKRVTRRGKLRACPVARGFRLAGQVPCSPRLWRGLCGEFLPILPANDAEDPYFIVAASRLEYDRHVDVMSMQKNFIINHGDQYEPSPGS